MKEISARARHLGHVTQAEAVRDIDEYLHNTDPRRYRTSRLKHELDRSAYTKEKDLARFKSTQLKVQWDCLKKGIILVIGEVKELLYDVSKERGDFILEDAYKTLISTMSDRVSILERVSEIPAPSTDEEREALQKLNKEYKRLLASFGQAIDQLNLYLKDKDNA